MKIPKFTISSLMVVVVLVALVFAAIKNPTHLCASATYTTTVGLLLFSLLGVAYRRGNKQRFWLGFAVFGWGYLGHLLASGELTPPSFVTSLVVGYLDDLLVPIPPNPVRATFDNPPSVYFHQIGLSIAVILVALLGTLLVRVFRIKQDEPQSTAVRETSA